MGRQALALQAPFLKESGFLPETPPESPALGRLAEIAVSVLVAYGDLDDETVGEIADTIAAGCKRGRWAIIPGTAHFPNMEKPSVFNRIAMDYWDRLPKPVVPEEEGNHPFDSRRKPSQPSRCMARSLRAGSPSIVVADTDEG